MPLSRLLLSRLEITLAAALTALLDQASKLSAQAFLQDQPSYPVINGFFHLTYTENTGAAFGLLRDSRFLLSALSLLFLLAVILFSATTPLSFRRLRLALGAGIGGAVSNLLDRFTRGYVIDFLDFSISDWHWPAFNLADVAIVLGLGLLFFRFLLRRSTPASAPPSQPAQERTDENVS